MTQIVWSPKSLRDLEAIQGYIAQFNPTAAGRVVQKIIRRTDRLQSWPLSGGHVPEDATQAYRQVIMGNYRVIYRYDESSNRLTVITVIHAARLLDLDADDSNP
jgi:addiction module RelE/StbE family toxin